MAHAALEHAVCTATRTSIHICVSTLYFCMADRNRYNDTYAQTHANRKVIDGHIKADRPRQINTLTRTDAQNRTEQDRTEQNRQTDMDKQRALPQSLLASSNEV